MKKVRDVRIDEEDEKEEKERKRGKKHFGKENRSEEGNDDAWLKARWWMKVLGVEKFEL